MWYVQTYLRIQVDITGLIKSERYQHLPCKLSQFCFVESNQVDIGQRSAPQNDPLPCRSEFSYYFIENI